MTDLGGDPACWLHAVCPTCGQVLEDGVPHTCPSPAVRAAGPPGGSAPAADGLAVQDPEDDERGGDAADAPPD